MKFYNIIAGTNGVGKSSFTGVIKLRENLGRIIDVEDAIKKGISFTQETTLSGRKTLSTVRAAKEQGFAIRLFYIGLDSPEECIKRIENRVSKGGHHIPTEDVLRRFAGRFNSLIEILPFCDEVLFFDNDNGFREIGEYKSDELLTKTDKIPQWYEELRKEIMK